MHSEIKKGEEILLCYGERANSFLLVEYGFTIKNNKYDFVRLKNITIDTIINHANFFKYTFDKDKI